MGVPRPVLPGKTYMLTRRCYQRTFRLRPSAETNGIFRYCLALAAARTGVQIHAVCVMSNHHHIVLTDVEGRLPEFARELHRSVAKALNASQGQWENLFSAEQYHRLELAEDEDVIDKIAYVAANPVEAGLVEAPADWPGVLLLPGEREESWTVERPEAYFATAMLLEAVPVRLCVTPPMWKRPGLVKVVVACSFTA